jgi:hypothetical protein
MQKTIEHESTTVDKAIKLYRLMYKDKWRNRSDYYWLWRLLQEVFELIGTLLHVHKDSPDWELRQIASICANWMEKRQQNN